MDKGIKEVFVLEKLINVDNITFEYDTDDGAQTVLKDFSVSFEAGAFTAVLGHNGSGKSTLAKLLNGLLTPSKGKVTVNGMDTADEERSIDIKRTVGMVFQNPDNQLVATVVDEDVAFGLENLGIPHSEMVKRVDEALAAVGMSEFKKSAPHNLSGGQKQRVAIAGIIAMEPKCIVFDEPTAMLDPRGRKEVMDVILKLCREKNITVILITHYMNEAALADRAVVLDKGKIVLDGKPSDVFMEIDTLRHAGLDVPQPTELCALLKKSGIDLKKGVLSVEDSVEAITQVLSEEV